MLSKISLPLLFLFTRGSFLSLLHHSDSRWGRFKRVKNRLREEECGFQLNKTIRVDSISYRHRGVLTTF